MMSAETEQFERRLKQQPLREIPADWREVILRAARPANPSASVPPFSIARFLVSFFWPHPKAWASLAAAWLVILTLHFYTVDSRATVTKNLPPPSPEFLLALKEQRRELAKLVEPISAGDSDRPKFLPTGPRSERAVEWLTA